MKKNKSLSKGMTLVEVIVAMTIFAIMASTIIAVLGAAYRQIDRSKRRDIEAAQQAAAVNKKDNVTKISGATDYKIVYTPTSGGTSQTANNIKLYQSNDAQFGGDFGFNMKSLTSNTAVAVPTPNPDPSDPDFANQYKIKFTNTSHKAVNIYVTISSGYVYEGNASTGYLHTSCSYVRTAQPDTGGTDNIVDFGYRTLSFAPGDIKVRFVSEDNSVYGDISLDAASFTATDHTKEFSYDGTTWS